MPHLEVPTNISVTAGQARVVTVVGSDDDNDQLTYKLLSNASGTQTIDPITGIINATFNATNPSAIRQVLPPAIVLLREK